MKERSLTEQYPKDMSPTTEHTSGKKTVPRLFLLTLLIMFMLPSFAGGLNRQQFVPYIEESTLGSIDWDKGVIYGIGRAYLDENDGSALRAQAAARVLASGNIVKLAAGIRINGQQTLQSLGSEKSTINLKAFLRDSEVSSHLLDEQGRSYYEIMRVAQVKGVEGLTARLLAKDSDIPVDLIPAPQKVESTVQKDEEQPWLILDARSLPPTQSLHPALFPKIISENGEEIYKVVQVSRSALLERGMASYVAYDESQADLESFQLLLARLSQMVSLEEAHAAEKHQRRKRQPFIVKNVKKVSGIQRTNLVISASDAKDLKTEDASSKILQDCRVIIVMSSPVGGIEGAILKIIPPWS